jgi:hypothetical protein
MPGSRCHTMPRTCSLCSKPVHGRGLCSVHYYQQKKAGAETKPYGRLTDEEVAFIRSSRLGTDELGRFFKVVPDYISRIRTGKARTG